MGRESGWNSSLHTMLIHISKCHNKLLETIPPMHTKVQGFYGSSCESFVPLYGLTTYNFEKNTL